MSASPLPSGTALHSRTRDVEERQAYVVAVDDPVDLGQRVQSNPAEGTYDTDPDRVCRVTPFTPTRVPPQIDCSEMRRRRNYAAADARALETAVEQSVGKIDKYRRTIRPSGFWERLFAPPGDTIGQQFYLAHCETELADLRRRLGAATSEAEIASSDYLDCERQFREVSAEQNAVAEQNRQNREQY